jgi:serine/threonine protein kinase
MNALRQCPFCHKSVESVAIRCSHCGSILSGDWNTQTELSEQDLHAREVLSGHYDIKGVIGRGGMAVVYKAIQLSLDRPVALKVVHQNLAHDQEFLKRFLREARVSASLNHHNIVIVHDVGSIGSIHYMAMEFLRGITLSDYLRQHGRLSLPATLAIMRPVADALNYIHQRGLVHRDLKPSNIIITQSEDQRPVLTDFGIVYVRSDSRLSQVGAIMGTPEYMSPEQASGSSEPDQRSDLYSFAVILYECLTGQVPFRSENPLATLHLVMHEKPRPPVSLNAAVPGWMNDLLMTSLSKNRDERVADMSRFAAILDSGKFRKGSGKSKPAAVPAQDKVQEKSRGFAFRRERLLAASIAIVVLMLLGILSRGLLSPAEEPGYRRNEYLENGNAKFRNHKYAEAVEIFESGLREYPGDAVLRERLEFARKALAEEDPAANESGNRTEIKPSDSTAVIGNNGNQISKNQTPQVKNTGSENTTTKSTQESAAVLPLKVTTGQATNITSSSATLEGTATPNGAVARAFFEYSTSGSLRPAESTTPHEIDGTSSSRLEADLSNLQSGTTYFYRIFAEREDGERKYGTIKSFATQQLINSPVVSGVTTDDLSRLESMGISLVLVEAGGSGSPGYDYYIARHEVTQELWKSIMESNPSIYSGNRLPVESISYSEIDLFLTRLNQKTGLQLRLPTEQEWAYASRGGKEGRGFRFSGSNSVDQVACYEGNSKQPQRVASRSSNELGLWDMSGNVWEICSDGVMCGGGFLSPINLVNIGSRERIREKSHDVGFRLCLDNR